MTITEDTSVSDILEYGTEHGIDAMIDVLEEAGEAGQRAAHNITTTIRTMHDEYRRRVFGDEATDLLDDLTETTWDWNEEGTYKVGTRTYPRFFTLVSKGGKLEKADREATMRREKQRAERLIPRSKGSMGEDWFDERG